MNVDTRIASIPCFWHRVVEETPEGSIQCFECRHVYANEADLVETEIAEWASFWDEVGHRPTAAEIMCCPLCVHDW